MYISSVTIENFRNFDEKTEIRLSLGMNLILGENNAGKSTFLEAFSLEGVSYNPHLSLTKKQYQDSVVDEKLRIGFQFTIGKDELFRYLGETVVFPLPQDNSQLGKDFPSYLQATSIFDFGVTVDVVAGAKTWSFSHFADDREFSSSHSDSNNFVLSYTCTKSAGLLKGSVGRSSINNLIGGPFASQIRSICAKIYKFKAERLNITRSAFGAQSELKPDASNLAECLNALQSTNSHLFDEYTKHVRHIFPSVHRIQIVPVNNTELEIRALLTPAENRRPDLSIPLSQAGTGIGQVLSILYVAMLYPMPMTLAIDEPNSFLHPKAVRSLFQILNNLPTRHQYVITTHSPEVIRAASPQTITVISNDEGKSKTEVLNPNSLEDIKAGLGSIGARLSDLYGADRILWVEGETEEITFPRIASIAGNLDVVGVTMLKVNATGDFESPRRVRPRMVFETYRNLGTAGALLPPAVGFVFDSEGRSSSDMESLTRDSDGAVRFLPRLCFENYILHPTAIAQTLSQTCGETIDADAVDAWIQQNGNDRRFISRDVNLETGAKLLACDEWISAVHAPKLLKALFNELPAQPEEYRKTTHSVAVTDWLLNNSPNYLSPLADVLRELFVRS